MSCVWLLQRGHSGDGCDLASTFFKYDIKEGRFVCSELGKGATREAGSISSEPLMYGRGGCSIVLLPLVARCLETIDVYIYGACLFLCLL